MLENDKGFKNGYVSVRMNFEGTGGISFFWPLFIFNDERFLLKYQILNPKKMYVYVCVTLMLLLLLDRIQKVAPNGCGISSPGGDVSQRESSANKSL